MNGVSTLMESPIKSLILGDIDHDHILDRLPPGSLTTNVVNITEGPPSPYTAWRITMNDGDYTYQYIPIGNRWGQLALFVLLWLVPLLTAGAVIWLFIKSFYSVKFNEVGVTKKRVIIPLALRRKFKKLV